MLPNVPYYTHADYLIIFHTGFVSFFTVLIVFGSPWISDFSNEVENWISITFFVVWLAYNSIWFYTLEAIKRQAPNLAKRQCIQNADDSKLMATVGSSSEREKDGVFLYSLQKIESPEWPKTHSTSRFYQVFEEHMERQPLISTGSSTIK